AGSAGQPKTAAIFSNVTSVGPKGNGSIVLPVGEKFEKAFRLRRNTAVSCFNSLVVGWEKGLSIEGTAVVNNVNGDTLLFSNNILTGFTNNTNTVYNAGTSGGAASTSSFYTSFWGADGNDSTQSIAQVSWVNLFTPLGTTPDARLAAGSVAGSGASFIHPKFFSVSSPVVSTTSYTYCQGEIASVLSATSASGNSLKWYDLPTGGTPLASAPVPSTSTSGVYSYYVSQANSNNDESPRVAITVTINALPSTPIISANGSLTFCEGSGVTLSAPLATSYVWSNGSTTQSIIVTTGGNYSVTISDYNNCSASSFPSNVTVQTNATPFFSQVSPICSGESLNVLPVSSLNTINGTWFPALDNTQTTTYTFTPDAGQCATNATLTVNVNANPTAVINYIGALNFCQGGSVVLTSNAQSGNNWSNGPSNSSITVNTSGAYTLTVIDANGCTDVSESVTVNVTTAPTPTISASSLQACTGQTITLTSTPADFYTWSNGATSQSITVNASGSFTVTTTNADACNGVGTSNPITATFNTVNPTVTSSVTQACSGELVILTSSLADSYLWSNGDTTQSIAVTSSGNFSVITTNVDACAGIGTSNTVNVTFTTTPTAAASFSSNGNVITFSNSSTGATSYSWNFGDFTNSSAASPVHAYAVNGTYQVVLTAVDGNCSDTTTFNVAITVSVEELMGLNNITIYPNPANESLFVAFENQSGSAFKLLVSDRVGRIIQTIDVQDEDQNFVTMNVSSLANGMYSILFVGQNSSFTKSFIVAK
ncbi:MAG: hypothetical protein RL528_418, partial [Bacteroidota bacterium]